MRFLLVELPRSIRLIAIGDKIAYACTVYVDVPPATILKSASNYRRIIPPQKFALNRGPHGCPAVAALGNPRFVINTATAGLYQLTSAHLGHGKSRSCTVTVVSYIQTKTRQTLRRWKYLLLAYSFVFLLIPRS